MTLLVKQIIKRMPQFILKADFQVNEGERAVLWGKSGSGKTTLLRIIAGLESFDVELGGQILLGDRDLTCLPPQKREVGLVFQDQVLFPSMSVIENAAFGLKIRGVSSSARREEALLWLDRVGLKSKAESGVDQLSVGERQRVAFIRALIWKPRLLLLDEPFSAMDKDLRTVMRAELLALHQLCPVPMILVTHDESDAEVLATARLDLRWSQTSSERFVSRSS